MNTLRKYGAKYNVTFCTFAGLSTDTKPVGTALIDNKSVALANGSKFIEMDTNKKYLYDAESQTWNLADSGGGGGSATLIEKSITENGEYNASDDNADGYSKVTVDVAVPTPETFEVEMTITTSGQSGSIVSSKTHQETVDAIKAGKNIEFSISWNGSTGDVVCYALRESGNISIIVIVCYSTNGAPLIQWAGEDTNIWATASTMAVIGIPQT